MSNIHISNSSFQWIASKLDIQYPKHNGNLVNKISQFLDHFWRGREKISGQSSGVKNGSKGEVTINDVHKKCHQHGVRMCKS